MNLVLTDFMQTVSLKDPKNPKSFLVFTNGTGEELRVPVGPEAIEAITRFAFKPQASIPDAPDDLEEEDVPEAPGGTHPGGPEEDPPEEEDFDGATVFGGEEEETPDPIRPFELPRVPVEAAPKSEEEIASL